MRKRIKDPRNKMQIVPLFPGPPPSGDESELFNPAENAAAPANAHLAYQGGLMLASVKVFTVFWGPSFADGATSGTLPGQIKSFFDTILAGALMDQLAEYNTGGYQVGKGTRIGSKVITAAPAAIVTDAGIQTQLQNWLASDPDFPQPDNSTLYFIYTQSGTVVSMQNAGSCTDFCGYHSDIGNSTFYAVMPYPDCNGCLGNLSVIDALTGTSSHELCEAITDAVPGAAWYDIPNDMEIGDLCAWQFKQLDGYNVQLEWSNAAGNCV